MLYSKNGSIPKTETDGTEGWVEVPEPPVAPEGMEVVWWCPPGWVVRPPMPVEPGYFFKWSQSQEEWMRFADEPAPEPDPTPDPTPDPSPSGTATDTITLGTAGTTLTAGAV